MWWRGGRVLWRTSAEAVERVTASAGGRGLCAMEEPRKPDAGGAEPAAPRSPREEEEELSEVGRERKRKREEKRAQKALRAEANKDRKPWLSQAGAAAGQGTADGTTPAAEASGSAYKKHKKRGWMTRLEERNGAGGIENIDFETYFVPAPEDLAVTAPHWQLLKDSLKGLQARTLSQVLAVVPSWRELLTTSV